MTTNEFGETIDPFTCILCGESTADPSVPGLCDARDGDGEHHWHAEPLNDQRCGDDCPPVP